MTRFYPIPIQLSALLRPQPPPAAANPATTEAEAAERPDLFRARISSPQRPSRPSNAATIQPASSLQRLPAWELAGRRNSHAHARHHLLAQAPPSPPPQSTLHALDAPASRRLCPPITPPPTLRSPLPPHVPPINTGHDVPPVMTTADPVAATARRAGEARRPRHAARRRRVRQRRPCAHGEAPGQRRPRRAGRLGPACSRTVRRPGRRDFPAGGHTSALWMRQDDESRRPLLLQAPDQRQRRAFSARGVGRAHKSDRVLPRSASPGSSAERIALGEESAASRWSGSRSGLREAPGRRA